MESVALVIEGNLKAERRLHSERGHGPNLLDEIHGVLQSGGLRLSVLDGLVIGLGPGSFTGLRIGLATLKGLALAQGLPLYGVRTGAAYWRQGLGRRVLSVLDARRDEVFIDAQELPAPLCCAPQRLSARLPFRPEILLGDGALKHREVLEEQFPEALIPEDSLLHQPQAALLAAEIKTPATLSTLEPLYLRPSDAELNYPDGFPDAIQQRPRGQRGDRSNDRRRRS